MLVALAVSCVPVCVCVRVCVRACMRACVLDAKWPLGRPGPAESCVRVVRGSSGLLLTVSGLLLHLRGGGGVVSCICPGYATGMGKAAPSSDAGEAASQRQPGLGDGGGDVLCFVECCLCVSARLDWTMACIQCSCLFAASCICTLAGWWCC
jgi:hypothetical protein